MILAKAPYKFKGHLINSNKEKVNHPFNVIKKIEENALCWMLSIIKLMIVMQYFFIKYINTLIIFLSTTKH